jgi:hypothetical protein
MAEIRNAGRANATLVESLVKKHFGPEVTSRLAWSVTKGRYRPSDQPRRLAAPQRLFGIRLWWKTIGEFSDNLGFRLELWQPEYLRQAQAFVADYNARTPGTTIELLPCFETSPGAPRAAAT